MTDRDDIPLPPHGRPRLAAPADDLPACAFCGAPADRETLAKYGARCYRCFCDFCSRPIQAAAEPRYRRRELAPAAPVTELVETGRQAGGSIDDLMARLQRRGGSS